MHLAGMGGTLLRGVLGVHCASAEAEREGGVEEMRGTHLFERRRASTTEHASAKEERV